ncbi:MAG: hypothetical protein CMJ87_00575 [Planctomycetes bacterium]|nr:hypothetical protein [Planctomycetota bacterium]
MVDPGEQEPEAALSRQEWDARPGSKWRGVVFGLPVMLFFLLGASLVGLGALLFPGAFRRSGHRWLRILGRLPLIALGIRVEAHGLEHRDLPGPKIVLFNHVSLLDLMTVASVCPPGIVVIYKKELERVPGLGWGLRWTGMIPVDRSDHEQAIKSVHRAHARLSETRGTLLMAPEGTRSRAGGLQRFKLGAFHVAANMQIPIIALVQRGIPDLLPMGSFLARSGRVRIDYLPPVDTSAWSVETVREHADEVRELYLQYLKPAPPRPPKTRP